MRILKLDSSEWEEAYNILCKSIYGAGRGDSRTQFGSALCQIEPGGHASRHSHDDFESFHILKGKAKLQIAEEVETVEAHDVILIPPGSPHRIDNLSQTEPLEFTSTYWLAPTEIFESRSLMVVPAPPTPNGALHLGHLSGPYLSADVYSKAVPLLGGQSALVMGTDDNQCYVPAKARELKISSKEVVDRFRPQIQSVVKKFGGHYDCTLAPLGNDTYTQFVQKFFGQLVTNGAIQYRKCLTPYCPESQSYLYGAQISGLCPHCRTATGGNGCEACGHYNDGCDLIQPTSNLGNQPVEMKETERYYFPLSEYRQSLSEILKQIEMPPALRAFYSDYLDGPLPDVSASQFAEWGIPLDGHPGQVIYEWVEMAAGYLYLSERAASKIKTNEFWRSPQGGVVEAFGFDNSFFYGLLIPALLHAYDPDIRPPKGFLFNYFYQLDGKKFSTSRNHAIWGHEILEEVPSDPLRFYLSLTRSENSETNFSLEELKAFTQLELINRWQPFFALVDTELRETQYQWPAAQALSGYQERFVVECNRYCWEIREHYHLNQFSLRQAASTLLQYQKQMHEFLDRYRHQKQDRPQNLSLCLAALQQWGALLSPLMPTFATELAQWLGPCASNQPDLNLSQSEKKLDPFQCQHFEFALSRMNQFMGRTP